MRGRFAVRLGRAVAASALLAVLPAAWGSSVNVTLNNGGLPFAGLAVRGTVTVDAYSQQGATKNMTTTSNVTIGGNTVNPTPGAGGRAALGGTTYAIGSSPSINASYVTGRNLVLKNLGPTVNLSTFNGTRNNSLLNKASLTMVGDQYTINSNTGSYTGQGQAIINAMGRQIRASATVGANPPVGEAAGRALDPFAVASGADSYAPTLNAEVDIDSASEVGGIEAFATDSNEFSQLSEDATDTDPTSGEPLFDFDGDPLGDTLWHLSIGTDGETDVSGDLAIDFELNPNAFSELDFSHTVDAGDTVSQIDAAIDAALAADETTNGDDFVFNVPDIMPAGTMFDASAGEVYADEVDADISAAPLPGAAGSGMVLIGLIGAFKLRRAWAH